MNIQELMDKIIAQQNLAVLSQISKDYDKDLAILVERHMKPK